MKSGLVAMICLLGAAGIARAEGEKISSIQVINNTKTNAETVKLISHIDVGDTFTYDMKARALVDLQSCGLFQQVDLFTDPMPDGSVRLTISAKDKFSWIIAPTFYDQPGNIGGGLGYGENNLFGENKKLLLYAQLATAESMFFGVYLDPSIAGSRFYWRFDTWLRHARVTEFDSRDCYLCEPQPQRLTTLNYLNVGALIGINLWRGWSFDFRLRTAYVFYRDTEYADGVDPAMLGLPLAATPPESDGWDTSLELELTRDKRANWNGIFSGSVVGVTFERSLPDLGSAFDYWAVIAHAEFDKKILETHNLVLKLYAGLGNHLPFQQEFTSGGTDLRGYEVNQFRGDMKLSSRLEYSFQLFWTGPLAWRMLGFWDSAYTSFVNSDDNLQRDYLPGETDNKVNRWRNGIGAGIRVYVKSIVLPLLGVDIGYGVEVNDYHIYFAVGLTEL